MKFRSNPQSRSGHRLVAVLAVAAVLTATFPSRAEDDLLALAYPRNMEPSALGGDSGFGKTLTPDGEPATSPAEPIERNRSVQSVQSVEVRLEAINNVDVLAIALPLDGTLGQEDAAKLAHFFRCRRTGRQHTISPGVLAMLADVAAHWPNQTIQIISGFRAPPFGVPRSKHFKGQAIDLRIPGISTTKLRDYVWRENRGVGVGYYAKENFVHIDSRPGEQDQAWTASQEGSGESYNPLWARKVRRLPPTREHNPAMTSEPVATTPSGSDPAGT